MTPWSFPTNSILNTYLSVLDYEADKYVFNIKIELNNSV